MPEPSLTRDEVSRTLRELRAAAGLTVTEAAKAVGVAQSTLTRYEGGKFVPPEEAVKALLAVYKPTRSVRARLLGATRERHTTYRQVVMHSGAVTAQKRIADAEKSAHRIVTFTPTCVPGLLQTEPYMRAFAEPAVGPERIGRWVANRVSRKALLENPAGRDVIQLVTAGALLWNVGGPDVMRGQLAHLVDVARMDTVRLGVIPTRVASDVLPLHAFDLHESAGGSRMVSFGTHGGVVTVTDARAVDEYLVLLAKLEELAVYGEDAAAEIESVARFASTGH